MKTHLFSPFGMGSSGYVWSDKMEKLMAHPHGVKGEPIQQNHATVEHVSRFGSAGELRTTPTDYAKFVIEVIDPKPPDAFRLKSDTVKEMLRPQVDLPVARDYPSRSSWALGWQILHTDHGDLISHGGDNEGFHAMHVASGNRKSGFVVMTNGENGYKMISQTLKDLVTSFV
jgi:CubicO group peptidase (beta-lactamase class C family)